MSIVIILLLIPILLVTIYAIFWLIMIVDAVKRDRVAWAIVILILHGIGPVLYYILEYRESTPPTSKPKPKTVKSKPAAKKRK